MRNDARTPAATSAADGEPHVGSGVGSQRNAHDPVCPTLIISLCYTCALAGRERDVVDTPPGFPVVAAMRKVRLSACTAFLSHSTN